ncbi:MAG: hypothetical protein CVV56_06585 [Tenericutes bacterium HGW-Tenericutes-1]|jgi:menaquinone-dependent protoporphyrinogen IX oxidase|nr:MAG: hypothetical protein CVV56_06585 [Tenericutes bacterium HGW-Tenericutes-1]
MKNIVLYKSKYGNTLQYATWLSETLGYELRDFKDFKKREIKNYQTIIFGSGVYMGKMNKLKKVLKWFNEKPIIIFACAGNLNVEKDIEEIKKANFTLEQLKYHHFFYLPGGVDFTKLKGLMKSMVKFFINMIEKKQDKTPDEIAILDGYKHPSHYVDKKYIEKIVNYVQTTKQS